MSAISRMVQKVEGFATLYASPGAPFAASVSMAETASSM
jgi:hypothetical protein